MRDQLDYEERRANIIKIIILSDYTLISSKANNNKIFPIKFHREFMPSPTAIFHNLEFLQANPNNNFHQTPEMRK